MLKVLLLSEKLQFVTVRVLITPTDRRSFGRTRVCLSNSRDHSKKKTDIFTKIFNLFVEKSV